MRWIYYFGCWIFITESFLHEFNRIWNLFWLIPCLFGIAALAYCLVQYERHPREQLYLHTYDRKQRIKVL